MKEAEVKGITCCVLVRQIKNMSLYSFTTINEEAIIPEEAALVVKHIKRKDSNLKDSDLVVDQIIMNRYRYYVNSPSTKVTVVIKDEVEEVINIEEIEEIFVNTELSKNLSVEYLVKEEEVLKWYFDRIRDNVFSSVDLAFKVVDKKRKNARQEALASKPTEAWNMAMNFITNSVYRKNISIFEEKCEVIENVRENWHDVLNQYDEAYWKEAYNVINMWLKMIQFLSDRKGTYLTDIQEYSYNAALEYYHNYTNKEFCMYDKAFRVIMDNVRDYWVYGDKLYALIFGDEGIGEEKRKEKYYCTI